MGSLAGKLPVTGGFSLFLANGGLSPRQIPGLHLGVSSQTRPSSRSIALPRPVDFYVGLCIQ